MGLPFLRSRGASALGAARERRRDEEAGLVLQQALHLGRVTARSDDAADVRPVGVGELGSRERLAAVGDDVGLARGAQHGGLHARLVIGDARGAALLLEAIGAEEGEVRVEAAQAAGAPAADERMGTAPEVSADEEDVAFRIGEDARELEGVREDREPRVQQELLGDGVRRAAGVEQD